MRRLILKIFLFLFPFLILYTFNFVNLSNKSGDLVRMSYFYNPPKYNLEYISPVSSQKQVASDFFKLKDNKIIIKKKHIVMSIGDSFSEQDMGYVDFLTEYGIDILNLGRFNGKETNPFQKAIDLYYLGLLDSLNCTTIILESVERSLFSRLSYLNYSEDKKIDLSYLKESEKVSEKCLNKDFFEYIKNSIIKAPIYYFLYNKLGLKPDKSEVYIEKTKDRNNFSAGLDKLLFFYGDLEDFKFNKLEIDKLTNEIDKFIDFFRKKNIKVYLLIAPDKYDIYQYDLVKKSYPKSLLLSTIFSNVINSENIIESEKIILEMKNRGIRDLYYFGDTHWTPIVSREIAKAIVEELNEINKLSK